jgi:hypothetical protein
MSTLAKCILSAEPSCFPSLIHLRSMTRWTNIVFARRPESSRKVCAAKNRGTTTEEDTDKARRLIYDVIKCAVGRVVGVVNNICVYSTNIIWYQIIIMSILLGSSGGIIVIIA